MFRQVRALHRERNNGSSGPAGPDQELIFKGKTARAGLQLLRHFQGIAAETALGVREPYTGAHAKPKGGESVRPASVRRTAGGLEIPDADQEVSGVLAGGADELRQVGGAMLAVRIHGYPMRVTEFPGALKTQLQRGSLSLATIQPEQQAARHGCQGHGRAVIHN